MYIPILVINLYLLYILNIVHLLYVQNYQYHVYFYVTHSKSSLLAEILAETEKNSVVLHRRGHRVIKDSIIREVLRKLGIYNSLFFDS